MSLIDVNGTTLHHERRGDGPTVLFVSGATGDAGLWTGVADVLASEYTVVTYDRRGNSRSPRPPGWTVTTIDEQADDAAALLGGLHLEQAIVLGTSAAAGIVANLALRHPAVLRGAVFHEPIFPSGVTNPPADRAGRRNLIEQAMAADGPRGATEAFLRSVGSDMVYESLDPALRERLLGNADVFFNIERSPFIAYEPTPDELTSMRLARAVTVGADNRRPESPAHWRYLTAEWLANQLSTDLVELPGGHLGYLGDPRAFALALRAVLRALA
jgi:pimeloyl-ACP methyl ester carboxylesterase